VPADRRTVRSIREPNGRRGIRCAVADRSHHENGRRG